MSSGREFAIIPAAGLSRRMGTHKLLLPWRGSTIIGYLLQTWANSQVNKIIVTIRADDHELFAECAKFPVDIVRPPFPPADMKESVQNAMLHAEKVHGASAPDRWFVAPADLPHLSIHTINAMISQGKLDDSIILPRIDGKVGHPVSFPWILRNRLFELGDGQGVNRILNFHRHAYLDLESRPLFHDVDTPEDYRRLMEEQNL